MKVVHINYSDFHGGAARASFRIHESLLEIGVDSKFWVNKSYLNDFRVISHRSKFSQLMVIIRPKLLLPIIKLLKTSNQALHSPSLLSSHWVDKINSSDCDIVHLHWIQGEMISISDIPKIKKPLVWTLHDMWGFCGAEHLSHDNRWVEGYCNSNRSNLERGFDLNKWIWSRKVKFWKKSIQIIAPSTWMGHNVNSSKLMNSWPCDVIPNPLNFKRWKPIDKYLARDIIGLPEDKYLILFGAIGGTKDPNKGFDLLSEALDFLKKNYDSLNIELVVYGEREPNILPLLNYKINYLGHLYDDFTLKALYSSVDVLIVPSRLESFCQAATEANSCGTPVVSFDVGGLLDIVEHKKTGYLAKKYNTSDLAMGIIWALTEFHDKEYIRQRITNFCSSELVAKKHVEVYRYVIENFDN